MGGRMDADRLVRPSGARASRSWLAAILLVGLLFVALGFASTSDHHPSPVRDTILIAGGALLVITGAVGLRSPTFSLSGHTRVSPSRLYAQAGVALLALGIAFSLLLERTWDTLFWLLPGILVIHRSWRLHQPARTPQDSAFDPRPDGPD
jgi:hypothetical protein